MNRSGFEDVNKRFEDMNKRFSALQWMGTVAFVVLGNRRHGGRTRSNLSIRT